MYTMSCVYTYISKYTAHIGPVHVHVHVLTVGRLNPSPVIKKKKYSSSKSDDLG